MLFYARTKVYPHFVVNGINSAHLTLDREITENALTFESISEGERLLKQFGWTRGVDIVDEKGKVYTA